ncbi:IPT/TIG domain-containing protein [Flavobacterium sp. LM5]|uniref:beta strand repeat-containing protein n=1 Tax=Flavobacterium sp. LM5 TaxID=1938610 RepID=UPI000993B20A|nr:IPT/TIG domain-containing protein [Flavobacterium sp. LM5]
MVRITLNNGATSVTIYKYVLLVFFFLGLGNTYYAQNLVHNFEFNGNLNDSQPTGELFSVPVPCTNTFGTNPNQWNWTATRSPGGGLFLATANLPNPENYTLALDFSFSDVSGKRKILSFGDFFENKGVYFLSGGIDQVDGSIYGFGTLNANTFYKLILTRDATTKELKTYIIGPSGVLQLLGTLTDTNNDAVPINSSASNRDFTFFLDDASTNNEYTASGSVRFIKIWDAPLSSAQLNTLFPSSTPTITSLSSLSGCQGSSLIINGTNLTGVQTVTIGGTAATVVSATATSVTVTVGSGTTGTVSVTTPSGTATSTEVYTVASGGALGSVCNPFTNVNQVTDATPNGLYYFNLGGNVFETKVEEGWVLVLNDGGAAVSQDLPEVTNLDTNLRGIVSSTALSNLGLVGSVKIKSSNAVLDVESTNATIISRVKAGQTIHQGQADNAINDSWIGASSANLTIDATCTTDRGTSLKTNIIHTCGSGGVGTYWIPSIGVRRVADGDGNVADSNSFGLWVKRAIPPTITSLSATSGFCGSSLTINGTFLTNTQTVTIGGTPATIVSTTAISVTVTVGIGTTGTVSITTDGGTVTSAETFTVSINPADALGSVCNPFTNVNQVTSSTPDGTYYFNLGGTTFQTKVEKGWVLIINDVGAPISQDLQEVTNLDVTIRGIVSNSALANLGDFDNVNIRSSDGIIDVKSNNTTIINRIKAGQTIHQGQADNAINDSWVGASAANIKEDAFCATSQGSSLKGNIIHTCGSSTGTNWIPNLGYRRINDGQGNVASSVSFGLWVQKITPPTITSLSATSGFCGSTLMINGTFLTNTQTVTIGGTPATIVSTTATSVTVTVGIGTTGTVSVTTEGGTATSAETFTVSINPADALGSVCNPFTNVNQVTATTPDGLYHFDLNGNKFETKVENGWVLVLNDAGASVKQGLQVVNTLDVTTRGILSNSALSYLGNFNAINVKSSNGVVDAFNNNATLVSRLKASQTLHQGSNDNAINDSWTGVGAVYLTTNATCPSGDGSALNGSVIHICGPSNTLNWIPNRGVREITDVAGFVGAGISFGLWIKKVDPPTITSLSSLNGCIGSTLVINGTNLATVQVVTVGGTAATVISTTETSVTVKIGNGTTGSVQLTTLGVLLLLQRPIRLVLPLIH